VPGEDGLLSRSISSKSEWAFVCFAFSAAGSASVSGAFAFRVSLKFFVFAEIVMLKVLGNSL
jgi:hypothetical protein